MCKLTFLFAFWIFGVWGIVKVASIVYILGICLLHFSRHSITSQDLWGPKVMIVTLFDGGRFLFWRLCSNCLAFHFSDQYFSRRLNTSQGISQNQRWWSFVGWCHHNSGRLLAPLGGVSELTEATSVWGEAAAQLDINHSSQRRSSSNINHSSNRSSSTF